MKGRIIMYTEHDFISPRDRVNEALIRRVLDNSAKATCCEGACDVSHEESDHRATWGLEAFPLASVYAPLQSWKDVYDLDVGFTRGTIFKELDLPFVCGERKGGCGCAK